jgi:predicted GIY-YIG superfamily endonuclease
MLTRKSKKAISALPRERKWYCYLLYNGRKTYIGISPDIDARLAKHNSGRGAKATRDGGYRIVDSILFSNHRLAAQCECRLKRASGLAARHKRLKQIKRALQKSNTSKHSERSRKHRSSK